RDNPSNKQLDGLRERPLVNGVVVFDDMSVNKAEDGYRLRARSEDLPNAEMAFSNPFDVN
ncbi:MAG TPA: hypothetical protein VFT84_00865, partial [Gemmatimonadales bacterium]|nr:hypothetical protein [Gemmatimonadales bacterium]